MVLVVLADSAGAQQPQPVEPLFAKIDSLPKWWSREKFDQVTWNKYIEAAKLLQKTPRRTALATIREWEMHAAQKTSTDRSYSTRGYLLLRIAFDVKPIDLPARVIWAGVTPNSDLLWPLGYDDQARLGLIASFENIIGGFYDMSAEYKDFLKHFEYRDLAKVQFFEGIKNDKQ